ncbi:MAG: HNH endonuclease signature motif containing protein [Anaerolineaceae bacterium]|nr:HNH endonuclease signature motif containing protein [Anaerolineaceae bacterium]
MFERVPVGDDVMGALGIVALIPIGIWFGYLFFAMLFWLLELPVKIFRSVAGPPKPDPASKPKRSPSPSPAPKPKPAPQVAPRPARPEPPPPPTPRKRDRGLREREFDALFRRDRGECGICGLPFDMLNFNPSSIEVDHIKPRAAGGTDDLDNLQLAHARCNQRKGARWSQPNSK